MKLVVLCVETDKGAQTDAKYIDKAIQNFYVVNNDVKISYVYMRGKDNYKSAPVAAQIKRLFSGDFDEKHVVYCIDIDNNLADAGVEEKNERIKEFCRSSGYELVWFCQNVEEVFLHKKIDKSEKKNEAKKFGRLDDLGKANQNSLSARKVGRYKSNLLAVLNKFMQKK